MVAAFAVGAANPNANVAAANTATNLIVFFKFFLQGISGTVGESLVVGAEKRQEIERVSGVWQITIVKTLKYNLKARLEFSPL